MKKNMKLSLLIIGGTFLLSFVTGFYHVIDIPNPLPAIERTKNAIISDLKYYKNSLKYYAFSLSREDPTEFFLSEIKDYVKTPKGGISWDIFGETKDDPYYFKDAEGLEWSGVYPKFSENLKSLDGKEVLIQGYMFPLEGTEQTSFFLLGPFPMSCPFHYHVPPNLVLEVRTKDPVSFSFDSINIKGVLELIPKDMENNVFYRLNQAEIVS